MLCSLADGETPGESSFRELRVGASLFCDRARINLLIKKPKCRFVFIFCVDDLLDLHDIIPAPNTITSFVLTETGDVSF